MKNINNYITEKLVINKNLKSNNYLDVLIDEWFFDYCNIEDFDTLDQYEEELQALSELKNINLVDKCIEYIEDASGKTLGPNDSTHVEYQLSELAKEKLKDY